MQVPESPTKKKQHGIFLTDIKKQASSFIQEKYKTAKLVLTDATQAQLLTEEATGSDPWGPDAKTMTRISEAAHDPDDYWRIVDIIHRRLRFVNYKEWRQSYKTLVLLEFLLTHGPEDMDQEFRCDLRVIRDLGKMNYVDQSGFNWGACMKQKSQKLLRLLTHEFHLAEERLKALKISKEIQGFGNLIVSPSASSTPSSSSSSSSSSKFSRTLSFGSDYSCDSPAWTRQELHSNSLDSHFASPRAPENKLEGIHLWDSPIEENGSLIDNKSKDSLLKENSPRSWSKGFSRILGSTMQSAKDKASALRSLSDIGRATMKRFDRQLSLGR